MVETKKASEKSAGREQRLHDLRSMRLLIPAVKGFKELKKGCDMGIVKRVGKASGAISRGSKGARRFAPCPNGGALPRTPAIFTLRARRVAGRRLSL
jgi:hypothetical protein